MRPVLRLLAFLLVATSLAAVPRAADAHSAPISSSGFVECSGSGDVIEVKGVTCEQAKRVIDGIYYDGKGTQVSAHRTDYLGFRCNWPNDNYSMSCRHKRFPKKKQINFFSD